MTNEEKQLLLKDLCARLMYDVVVNYDNHICTLNEIDPACKDIDYITVRIQDIERLACAKSVTVESIKPYLRPMSSMTKEERNEYFDFRNQELQRVAFAELGRESAISEISDWLNAHHFDYRGLIPMGLALEALEGMYKNE